MLDDMGVTIDPTAAGDHKPTAERNNRTLKERVRVALARLPYKVVPKVMVECLGRRAVELLNVFPQKDSISSHFSPQQLIDNVNINYKSDMVAELGHVLKLGAAAKGVTSMKFFNKKRDLETFQDGNQIAGVDDTEQGYLEEAFDQDYEPEDEDERDFNLHGQFDDIDDSKRNELLADADNDVDDMPELTVRFQGADDYESDDNNLGDEGDEEEEPIVADLDHHQENVNRGTNDIGSLVTDLEDLQEPPEEEIVLEPEEPQVAKVTQSGQTYVQAAMSGLNLSQVPKKPRGSPLSRSGSSANKNKNRVATRRKHREREMKPLKEKLKSGIRKREVAVLKTVKLSLKHSTIYYYINQGLKKFGDDGKDAVDKELRQMLLRDCFTPEFVKDVTASERKKAQSAMMLLAKKQFKKTIIGRLVYRGNGTCELLSREDTASPTALQEAITTTCVINAHKAKEGEDRIYMKITGMMVQILIDMAPEYREYIVLENGKRVIYVRVLRAIYVMLQSSLRFYNQFRSDLEAKGFVFNPYDPCVANKVIDEKQQTIRFHVDDLMSSHMDPKVNDEFAKWLNMRGYGSIKECTIIRGKIHRYLGMTLDFSVKEKLKIRMDDYVKNMLEDFPIKFNKDSKQETPAGNDLLEAG
ncbi:unnamed protein product [Cylindrotheca closterium]|uniref:Uncharacterized protein n=1 Tax=Cylindrotheca closterium TaxID=2856 RepID=A0AAD2CP90_9STRA|nr:unnamed protein product [Cylindrotheca closterium]